MEDSGSYEHDHAEMMERQLRGRNIRSVKVLDAFERVQRHLFVPENLRKEAYADRALPLGPGQTISQPFIVALMLEQLEVTPGSKILEVGTGSGYEAALLSELGASVYSIEVDPELAVQARERLQQLGYSGIEILVGNGYQGWSERGPYDGIVVSAAPDQVPRELVRQLKVGGRLVLPLGTDVQELVLLIKKDDGLSSHELGGVRFVPMRKY